MGLKVCVTLAWPEFFCFLKMLIYLLFNFFRWYILALGKGGFRFTFLCERASAYLSVCVLPLSPALSGAGELQLQMVQSHHVVELSLGPLEEQSVVLLAAGVAPQNQPKAAQMWRSHHALPVASLLNRS